MRSQLSVPRRVQKIVTRLSYEPEHRGRKLSANDLQSQPCPGQSDDDAAPPDLEQYFVRLVMTMAAGALMGFNRGVRGHASGLRTTILVTLAASVAMI